MKSIFLRQIKEYKVDKASFLILFVIIALCMCMLFIGNMDVPVVALLSVVLYLSQISGKIFAVERTDRTIETLISLPLKFKDIFVGKALFLLAVSFLPVLIIYLSGTMRTIISGQSNTEYFQIMFQEMILLLFSIINIAFLSTLISLKSYSIIDCGMKSPFILSILIIPFNILNVLYADSNLSDYSLYIDIGYFMLNLFIFAIIFIITRKYFFKPNVLELVTKGDS